MNNLRNKRRKKIRSKISGTAARPRIAIYRSGKHIYAQAIDDVKGVTLASVSEKTVKDIKGTKVEKAKQLGNALAEALTALKIKSVVFDRGGYRYHGRVKSLVEGIREKGQYAQ